MATKTIALSFVLLLCALQTAPAEETPPTMRVMTFNIRYGSAKDGENAWPKRRALVVDTIRAFDPDLLGTQEAMPAQVKYLREHLPQYASHGVGRRDGKRRGETVSIFYKIERFELLQSGHFWLSEQPDVAGSRGWDAAASRMVSWVKLQDKQTGRPIMCLNTHWDHRGIRARRESANLMRRFIDRIAQDVAVMVTGDFNVADDRAEHDIMLNAVDEQGQQLLSSYRKMHPMRDREEATFHGFRGTTRGSIIDWILHSEHLRTIEAAIDRTHDEGRYPSDHYPATAVVEWIELQQQ